MNKAVRNSNSRVEVIMKSFIHAVVLATALVVPLTSFAQSNGPKTRAEVLAELTQLEKAGYYPAEASNTTYPANIQAAEARLAQQNAKITATKTQVADTSGVGGTVTGSST